MSSSTSKNSIGPRYSSWNILRGNNWPELVCVLTGDPATGEGVNRHMMSTVMFKLISGFHINSGQTLTSTVIRKCLSKNCQWRLELPLADSTITRIFEGESDHLIPSVSADLIDNRLFTIAGRMIGHSFLHSGPSFPGLSPAVLHVLFGGSLETAPITLEDCPDLDIRSVVQAVRTVMSHHYPDLSFFLSFRYLWLFFSSVLIPAPRRCWHWRQRIRALSLSVRKPASA